MKVLHSTFSKTFQAGVINQMNWEQESANSLNIHWISRFFCPVDVICSSIVVEHLPVKVSSGKYRLNSLISWFKIRIFYYRWLKKVEKDFDILLLRYSVYDPFQWWFARTSKKPLCFVHHTLEVPELLLNRTFASREKALLEKVFGRYALQYASATIGVTREILDYERARHKNFDKPAFIYPNGICYNNFIPKDSRDPLVINILFTASYFHEWHGLDLLLTALKKTTLDFNLHLIGELSKKYMIEIAKDPRIIFHGKKSHSEIVDIASYCDIGLTSFALYRNKMNEACTLKVREYLMMGLPVYGGYKEVFPMDFSFYVKGVPDIDDICSYAKKWKTVSKEKIAVEARQYIDKKILLEDLYIKLKKIFNFIK